MSWHGMMKKQCRKKQYRECKGWHGMAWHGEEECTAWHVMAWHACMHACMHDEETMQKETVYGMQGGAWMAWHGHGG
jgi:hypothetical protein